MQTRTYKVGEVERSRIENLNLAKIKTTKRLLQQPTDDRHNETKEIMK